MIPPLAGRRLLDALTLAVELARATLTGPDSHRLSTCRGLLAVAVTGAGVTDPVTSEAA